jgi:SAM-dependent methyltransferase
MKYKAQVSADHYNKHDFDSLQIESITEQLRQICFSGYTNVLEIGVGNGFLRHCLSFFSQINYTSVDIAEDLCPDYICSVLEMPFEENQFDLIICCEVLEHLRFEDFLPALKEIRRVTKNKAIISLPDLTRHFGIALRLARFGWFKFDWNQSRGCYARKEYEFNGEHYWEIGFKNALPKDVIKMIKAAGFNIEKQFRLRKNPWHRFFILRS